MELTDAMLQAAMKAAVAQGLVPKFSISEDAYIKNWDAIKAVLQAALTAAEK